MITPIKQSTHRLLVSCAMTHEMRVLLEFLWVTGARLEDLLALTANQLTWDPLTVILLPKAKGTSVASIAVPLPPRLKPLLDQLPTHGKLFPSADFKTVTEKFASFRRTSPKFGQITPHSYRYAKLLRTLKKTS